jgi:hypothetical protein
MRRRKLLVALAALAVVVAVGTFTLWPRPHRFTREDCRRVREGMTRAEVEALLGPPGDYRTGPVDYDGGFVPLKITPLTMPQITPLSEDIVRWTGDSAYIAVLFDSAGCVQTWYVVPTSKTAQSPLGALLWRAERQWRRWFP